MRARCGRWGNRSRRCAPHLDSTTPSTPTPLTSAPTPTPLTPTSPVPAQAEDDLARAADAICLHAQRLLGCGEACLYVAPPAATEGADRPLHRVRNSHATPEDVAACSHTVLGAAASAPLKAGSIVASAAEARGLTLISNVKQDPRYHEASDRLPGLPPAQRTLLLNLSDEQGDVRAVLRCARPFTARHGTAGGWSGREAALAELGPLFTLTLRCCFSSSSPQVHHQHRQHRNNRCYYYQCYHYLTCTR